VADPDAQVTVSYENDILPLLTENGYGCTAIACHGSLLVGSLYSLTSHEGLLSAGPQAADQGMCSVRPGAPDESYVIWKVEGRSGIVGARMPSASAPMTPQDIATLRQWILEGARNN
jgi:hypothetical protein